MLLEIPQAATSLTTVVFDPMEFTRAAQQEEDPLPKILPGYADYARRTPRSLPRLWKNR